MLNLRACFCTDLGGTLICLSAARVLFDEVPPIEPY